MKILVINAGSSSLKYQLFNMAEETVMAKGICDRIGLEPSILKHTAGEGDTIETETAFKNLQKSGKLGSRNEYLIKQTNQQVRLNNAKVHRTLSGQLSLYSSSFIAFVYLKTSGSRLGKCHLN